MGSYNFNKDIFLGEDGEKIVVKDLETLNGTFISDNKDKRYDIIMNMPNGEVKYEIKTDVYCFPDSDTGNMFIEFECRGKESGIRVTEADWFVTLYHNLKEIWYIKTDKLKNILENNNIRQTKNSGDAGSGTRGYLLPRHEHKKDFIVRKVPKSWVE